MDQTQISILEEINYAASVAEPYISDRVIADSLDLSPEDIVTCLLALQRKGLVRLIESKDEGSHWDARLTARGHRLVGGPDFQTELLDPLLLSTDISR